jgi:hypothetical protein
VFQDCREIERRRRGDGGLITGPGGAVVGEVAAAVVGPTGATDIGVRNATNAVIGATIIAISILDRGPRAFQPALPCRRFGANKVVNS